MKTTRPHFARTIASSSRRGSLVVRLLLSACCLAACSESDSITGDEFAPATIQDLEPCNLRPRLVTLTWTAPGDDGNDGQALRYEVRGSIVPDAPTDSASWLVGEPLAKSAGTPESLSVALERNLLYRFAVRTVDEAGNWSEFSNVAAVQDADSTCLVKVDGTGDFATIAEAISSGGGCRIALADGTYSGVGNTVWPEGVSVRISSVSGDPRACVIDYNGFGSMGASVEIEGIGLRDGHVRTPDMGSSTVLLARSCLLDGVAIGPASSSAEGPNIVLELCEIVHARTAYDIERLELQGCVIRDNHERIAYTRELVLDDCSVFDNDIEPYNSLFISYDSTRVESCRFTGNNASIFFASGSATFTECLFAENSGVLIYLSGARAVITTSTFFGNKESVSVVGNTDQDRLRLERSIFADNGPGGVVFGEADLIEDVRCCDIYGSGGAWSGLLEGYLERNHNLSRDPLLCAPVNGDYRLRSASPCSVDSLPDCGGIGAFGIACP